MSVGDCEAVSTNLRFGSKYPLSNHLSIYSNRCSLISELFAYLLWFHRYLHVCLSYLLLVHFRHVPQISLGIHSSMYLSNLSFWTLHTKSWIYCVYLSLRLSTYHNLLSSYFYPCISASLLIYSSSIHLFIDFSPRFSFITSLLQKCRPIALKHSSHVNCIMRPVTREGGSPLSNLIEFTWSIHLYIHLSAF